MAQHDTILTVQDLRKYFAVRGGLFHTVQAEVKAVDGISFEVRRGEILGIVGESGCGKSTTARLLLRLIEPDAGGVYFEGRDIFKAFAAGLKAFRREVQMVFQDPYSSLNPRLNIEDAVAFNVRVHGASRAEARAKAWEVLNKVGLRAEQFGRRYPHELSGGQRQRVNIARALVLARPARHRVLERPRTGHVSRADRRARERRRGLYRATAPLHAGPLRVRALDEPRRAQRPPAPQRGPTEPDQSPLRMPFPHPLPACHGDLRLRFATITARWRVKPSGGLLSIQHGQACRSLHPLTHPVSHDKGNSSRTGGVRSLTVPSWTSCTSLSLPP